MIGAAIVFQMAAIFCFAVWAVDNKPETKAEEPKQIDIQAGQVYEFLIPGRHGEPSTIAYRKVLDCKRGHVKYLLGTSPSNCDGVEFIQPDEFFLSHARLLDPKSNPFEETKQ